MSDKSALNPNAPSFTPRLGAAVFVPGAAFHTQPTESQSQPPSSTTSEETQSSMSSSSAVVNGVTAQNEIKSQLENVHLNNPAIVNKEIIQPSSQSVSSDKVDETFPETGPSDSLKLYDGDDKLSPDPTDEWEGLEDENKDEDFIEGSENGSASQKKRKQQTSKPKTKKEYINVVFIGHVDAGKSTIGGHLLYLTGQVDKRTLEKYEKEAREMNRESWYLSWALDTNVEEREKGKTVQVGRACFETEKKHFTVLDAPGHKSFVPNMIGGASQADLAVLVISARKGEFEAGLERGGQTQEHATLVKTAGVKHMVVLINKMDDPTVNWDEERYDSCKKKLLPVLKKCGFVENKDLVFMPCSGFTGAFLKDVPSDTVCPWYRGPSLIDYLDSLPPISSRAREAATRVVLIDKYNDMGTVVMGKVESGVIIKGQMLTLMPNKTIVQALQLWSDDDEADEVGPGENVKIKLKGVEEDTIMSGFVLCSPDNVCKTGRVFDARVVILEHKSIIAPGYSAVLHIHAAVEEVNVKALLCLLDRKTGDKSEIRPRFVRQDQHCIMRLESAEVFCLEPFNDFQQLGRFVLRDENRTIAMGKVLKVIE